jgi:hypothetical protein
MGLVPGESVGARSPSTGACSCGSTSPLAGTCGRGRRVVLRQLMSSPALRDQAQAPSSLRMQRNVGQILQRNGVHPAAAGRRWRRIKAYYIGVSLTRVGDPELSSVIEQAAWQGGRCPRAALPSLRQHDLDQVRMVATPRGGLSVPCGTPIGLRGFCTPASAPVKDKRGRATVALKSRKLANRNRGSRAGDSLPRSARP